MAVTIEERARIIAEYESEKERERLINRARIKPLGTAQKYFKLLTRSRASLQHGWHNEVNEKVKKQICEKYCLERITELDPYLYDEANEYAIKLFTEETEARNLYPGGKIIGSFTTWTWEEWKKLCYDTSH